MEGVSIDTDYNHYVSLVPLTDFNMGNGYQIISVSFMGGGRKSVCVFEREREKERENERERERERERKRKRDKILPSNN